MLWCNRVWVLTVLQLMYKIRIILGRNFSTWICQLHDCSTSFLLYVCFTWNVYALHFFLFKYCWLETGSGGYRCEILYSNKALYSSTMKTFAVSIMSCLRCSFSLVEERCSFPGPFDWAQALHAYEGLFLPEACGLRTAVCFMIL